MPSYLSRFVGADRMVAMSAQIVFLRITGRPSDNAPFSLPYRSAHSVLRCRCSRHRSLRYGRSTSDAKRLMSIDFGLASTSDATKAILEQLLGVPTTLAGEAASIDELVAAGTHLDAFCDLGHVRRARGVSKAVRRAVAQARRGGA